ncbi:MAG TPA: hypothetical protein PKX57_10845 [Mesotoga sp.]|nr:hypothetical protein [Mesotoga sp.]
MLQHRCERFVAGTHSEEDLVIILRSLQTMWSRILERPVVLGLENAEIVVESPCGSPTFLSNMSMKDALRIKRIIGIEEKEIYYQTIKLLELMFRKLTKRQMEAIFWRLIDHSRKDGKPPSNRELASFLGITEGVLRRRLRVAYEKLGLDPVKTNNFVVLNLERE